MLGRMMIMCHLAFLASLAGPTGQRGVMTLTLPAGTVKIGESVEIGVKGSASGSRRFFMLYEATIPLMGSDSL